MYLLKRTDQKGGYVAIAGSKSSYTFSTSKMRRYSTIESAEQDRCVENEIIVSVESIFPRKNNW